jgi:Flp pilus assembly pilin Flp
MIQKFRRFMKGKRGQGMSEYIIMVGLIAIAAIGMYTAFGGQIRNAMEAIGQQLAGDTGAGVELNTQMAGQNAGKEVSLENFNN